MAKKYRVLMALAVLTISGGTSGKTTVKPNFIYAENGTYFYAAALTRQQKEAGVIAGDALGYRYYGKNAAGEYVLVSVSGSGQVTGFFYCKNPCRVIRTSDGERFVNNIRLLVGSAFADAIRGMLRNTNPELLRSQIKPVSIPSRPPFEPGNKGLDLTRTASGVKIRIEEGAPVHATANGIVEFAGRIEGYGHAVRLGHGAGLQTFYGNLERISVSANANISKGQVIGFVASALNGAAPMLIYEVRIQNQPVDPRPYMVKDDAEFRRLFQAWQGAPSSVP